MQGTGSWSSKAKIGCIWRKYKMVRMSNERLDLYDSLVYSGVVHHVNSYWQRIKLFFHWEIIPFFPLISNFSRNPWGNFFVHKSEINFDLYQIWKDLANPFVYSAMVRNDRSTDDCPWSTAECYGKRENKGKELYGSIIRYGSVTCLIEDEILPSSSSSDEEHEAIPSDFMRIGILMERENIDGWKVFILDCTEQR